MVAVAGECGDGAVTRRVAVEEAPGNLRVEPYTCRVAITQQWRENVRRRVVLRNGAGKQYVLLTMLPVSSPDRTITRLRAFV